MAGTTVVLLRGINVGGHNRLPMATLRTIAEGLGYSDIATHVQSGNIVFSGSDSPQQAATRIQTALAEATDIAAHALGRSADEWADVVERNPFAPEADADGKLVHVTFLADASSAEQVGALNSSDYEPERLFVSGREIYQSVPGGLSGGTLAIAIDRALDDPSATRRNWNTLVAVQLLLQK